jgi:hypothetical protein
VTIERARFTAAAAVIVVCADAAFLHSQEQLAAKPASAASEPQKSARDPVEGAPTAERDAIDRALAPLGNYGRELPLRIHAAAGWPRADRPVFWVVGELAPGQAPKDATEIELTLTQPNGGPAEATAHATIAAGARTFRAAIAPDEPLPPDDYVVRARVVGASGAPPAMDLFRLALPGPPDAVGALLYRRGPSTTNHEVPTADLRFRRGEHLRVDVPVPRGGGATARLLDRTGKLLPIPVGATLRDDADGSAWATADLSLAPLAVGDYVIEIRRTGGAGGAGRAGEAGSAGSVEPILVAFRVVP